MCHPQILTKISPLPGFMSFPGVKDLVWLVASTFDGKRLNTSCEHETGLSVCSFAGWRLFNK